MTEKKHTVKMTLNSIESAKIENENKSQPKILLNTETISLLVVVVVVLVEKK